MKNTRHLTFSCLSAAIVAALAVFGVARKSTAQSEARIADLQAATNCQIDVLAPLIQTYELARVQPAPSQSFGNFLTQQVAAGKLPEIAAITAMNKIEALGVGEPVHTSRGWVVPILIQSQIRNP